jgi:hypothetical protein
MKRTDEEVDAMLKEVGEREAKATSEPYFIEVDNPGCAHCKAERTWDVIGPDSTALSTSYGDEEDASDIADICNSAFEMGRQSSDIPALISARCSARREKP